MNDGEKSSVQPLTCPWPLCDKPPVRGLAALPEAALHYLGTGEAAIVSQSTFRELLSDHAHRELSEVWDIKNSVGPSKKCNR